ncbi:MAG: hypothetical protein KatS3mg112_0432 [Thermogutta sp.]|nr:MAG: hypothetical protein KatS3mg112_0432 [Thermogutta sp.]
MKCLYNTVCCGMSYAFAKVGMGQRVGRLTVPSLAE